MQKFNRRSFLKTTGAASLTALAASQMLTSSGKAAIGQPHVVVIGGGVGGLASIRKLRALNSMVQITLIEPKKEYVTPFMSNWALSGYKSLKQLTFNYKNLENLDDLNIIHDQVKLIDKDKKQIHLQSNNQLEYDWLILSPGIAYRTSHIENYTTLKQNGSVSAYQDGAEINILQKQLFEMKQGGTFLISAPTYPYRCPPAPYERATMAAQWLKSNNPTAKILIVDEKDSFSMQALFEASWANDFEHMIEHIPVDFAGSVTAIHDNGLGIETEHDSFEADLLCYIPNQKAGFIAEASGLTDETGWCPVYVDNFESKVAPDIFIIGDSAYASPMPKSAASALTQADLVATEIAKRLGHDNLSSVQLSNMCWSRLGPDNAAQTSANYEAIGGALVIENELISDVEASAEDQINARLAAENWFDDTTQTLFG